MLTMISDIATFKLKLASEHSVIAFRWFHTDGYGDYRCIVAVHLQNNAVTPYAVYRADGDGSCYSGQYCSNLEDCMHAFAIRAMRERENSKIIVQAATL